MRLRSGDNQVLKSSDINIKGRKLNTNIFRNDDFLLKSIYFSNLNNFEKWLEKTGKTKHYIRDILNNNKKIFDTKIHTANDLKQFFFNNNTKYNYLAIRNWLNFCENMELLQIQDIEKIRKFVKNPCKLEIDTYIPVKEEIETLLEKVKDYDKIGYLFVKILLESGLRLTEVDYFVKNIDLTKFEINENIAVYPLYYLRGTKSSYYLFIQKETYFQILENLIQIKEFNIEKLKLWINRHKLLSLKYLRKYHFTLMIKSGVQFDIANFIQGRTSQNIGFNHYLAKKEIAVKEYKKINL